MRLLNTTTLQFKEFFDADIETYAILSHRWEPSDSSLREIEYQELANLTAEERLTFPRFANLTSSSFESGGDESSTTEKATQTNLQQGRRPYDQRGLKIGLFCDMARTHGYDWAWVDTCCIDKRNSAELSEAINSMFRWYQRAARCYVYFNDVEWRNNEEGEDDEDEDEDDDEKKKSESLATSTKTSSRNYTQLRSSAWFTRGWTLQELLAPQSVQFFDRHWHFIGSRSSLSVHLSAATGISQIYLCDNDNHPSQTSSTSPFTTTNTNTNTNTDTTSSLLSKASIATKMSWASHRHTSRIEDGAYSLLGLFGIHMPMLYGEGKNAFLRLQRKIIKMTDDETIFAWTSPSTLRPHGMLAPGVEAFRGCADLVAINHSHSGSGGTGHQTKPRKPYAMTNKGLELQVDLPRLDVVDAQNQHQTLIFGLYCQRTEGTGRRTPTSSSRGEEGGRYLAIILEKFGRGWKRVNCYKPCLYKNVIETTFKVGSRTWPASSLTESTRIYVIEER